MIERKKISKICCTMKNVSSLFSLKCTNDVQQKKRFPNEILWYISSEQKERNATVEVLLERNVSCCILQHTQEALLILKALQ